MVLVPNLETYTESEGDKQEKSNDGSVLLDAPQFVQNWLFNGSLHSLHVAFPSPLDPHEPQKTPIFKIPQHQPPRLGL